MRHHPASTHACAPIFNDYRSIYSLCTITRWMDENHCAPPPSYWTSSHLMCTVTHCVPSPSIQTLTHCALSPNDWETTPTVHHHLAIGQWSLMVHHYLKMSTHPLCTITLRMDKHWPTMHLIPIIGWALTHCVQSINDYLCTRPFTLTKYLVHR